MSWHHVHVRVSIIQIITTDETAKRCSSVIFLLMHEYLSGPQSFHSLFPKAGGIAETRWQELLGQTIDNVGRRMIGDNGRQGQLYRHASSIEFMVTNESRIPNLHGSIRLVSHPLLH